MEIKSETETLGLDSSFTYFVSGSCRQTSINERLIIVLKRRR
jgi:hypothetical protein